MATGNLDKHSKELKSCTKTKSSSLLLPTPLCLCLCVSLPNCENVCNCYSDGDDDDDDEISARKQQATNTTASSNKQLPLWIFALAEQEAHLVAPVTPLQQQYQNTSSTSSSFSSVFLPFPSNLRDCLRIKLPLESLKFLLSFKSKKMLENQENQNYTIVEDFLVSCWVGSKESLWKPWILQKPYGDLLLLLLLVHKFEKKDKVWNLELSG